MSSKKKQQKKAYISIFLVIVNVLVFAYLSLQGMTKNAEFMAEHGAVYAPYIALNGEYYRCLSAVFLHFGFQHLLNNMVMLLAIGWNLELEIGKIPYLLIYLGSGVFANVVYTFWCMYVGSYYVSGGASGAVFGLAGALFCTALKNRGRVGNVSGKGVLLMIALMLYYGFSSSGVNNMAHVVGLITGFLLAAVLLLFKKK